MEKTKSFAKRKPSQRAGAKPLSTTGSKPRAAAKGEANADAAPRPFAGPAAVEDAAPVEALAVPSSPEATPSPEMAEAIAGAAPVVTAPKLRLESSLEIKDVEEVHRGLVAALAGGVALTVDISRVGAVDTAGVQLLMAFQSEASRRGMPVQFCGESAALTHALTVLGLRAAIRIATAHE
ncbi:MAG: STAS domain-containing protein [Pseudomonadota bacterium]|nr:STAS domain-containing protein [Pseudomonadota bacterium]